MLKLIDITKEYKVEEESVLALHGIDLEFRKNEFVSILGPSGCGKTTMLNIIGGLDRYTSGDIQIDGVSTREYDDVDWDTYRNRRIGFVFQSYNLIPHQTILNNVAMSLTLAGVGREERKQRAMEALRKVGLESQARKRPNQLSGGQMQRVAIARALVNNPEIILADEPTGALDSESGIQVMDLLKEVAEDRLVVMVTHNPTLAEEYSTRIVYLKDGELVGDTMPYDSAQEAESAAAAAKAEGASDVENIYDGADNLDAEAGDANNKKSRRKCCAKQGKFQKYLKKVRENDKSSMSTKTAFSLSFNNLLSKKGRTFLTSLAGSIGIIGIILVLSLSAGVANYVETIEQNALSQYPIQIDRTNMDINAAMDILSGSLSDKPEYPDGDTIFTQPILSQLLSNIDKILGVNDLASLKEYLDANFDDSLGHIKYEYGTVFNVYAKHGDKEEYNKAYPFSDVMNGVLDGMGDTVPEIANNMEMIEQFATALDAWDEITDNTSLLDQQYDLLGDSRWPQNWNEIVIVLDSKNQLNDYALFMLGLKSVEEIGDAFFGNGFGDCQYTVEELLNIDFRIMPNTAYIEETENGMTMGNRSKKDAEFVESNGEKLKVVGVVRPKQGAVITSINSTVGYTHGLVEHMIEVAEDNEYVKGMMEEYELSYGERTTAQVALSFKPTNSIASGNEGYYEVDQDSGYVKIEVGDPVYKDLYEDYMRALGSADLTNPYGIRIYCSTFEAKDKIIALLDDYASIEGNQPVKYTDYLEMMMGYVSMLTDTVTGALVAFSAISLLVSTIMIAIIIYTSVLERRKEIGVLRSLGARKKDISRVFVAESAMIGAYSGAIGLIVSAILTAIGNFALLKIVNIANLMHLTWWHCLMMFAISILLSVIAGFIPSRMAAKKDPAIALRSE